MATPRKRKSGANVVGSLLSGAIENINDNKKEETKEELKIDKEKVLAQVDFSFEIEEDTMVYLKDQTIKLHKTMTKAYGELGEIFSETQEKLANNKNGVFEKWFTALGYAKRTVYNLINRHNYIVQNLHNKEIVESLPLTLSYEITSPSCSEELRNMVLDGDIKTYKEFKEYKNLYKEKEEEQVEVIEYDEMLPTEVEELNKLNEDINKFYRQIKPENKPKLYKIIEKFKKDIEKILD